MPPPPPPPPSRAVAPPPPRRRQPRRRLKGRTYNIHVFNYYRYPPPLPVEEERDWTELPLDVTLKIFRWLDPVELLGRVGRVCRFWRHATRDEPELWRRIHMGDCSRDLRLDVFAREAVRRSSGRCEAFSGDYFGDDEFLSFLADQAPSLRSLYLGFFYKVTSEGFAEAIARLPSLEELELSNCHGIDANTVVFELVAKVCPRLRLFRHLKYRRRYDTYFIDNPNNDREASAIGRMHELRSRTLHYDTLTNEGLMAIVDNCPHLEYLDIRSCGNITMSDALKAKCARIKTKIYVPHRDKDDKDNCSLGSFQYSFCISIASSLLMGEYFQELLQKIREEDEDYYYDPYCYYLSALDEVHLEEHGRLLGKSGWRYNL